MNVLEEILEARFGTRLRRMVPLAPYTSFRIGGPADLWLEVETEEELAFAMGAAAACHVRVFCLGAGTNLLVSDKGIRGLVLRLGRGFEFLRILGRRVECGAALSFRELVERTVDAGLSGLEFGEGIPGTVGGGLVMNAGAFGGEIAKVVERVHGVNAEGALQSLSCEEMRFAYRHAELPPGFVISWVEFQLVPDEAEKLRRFVLEIRKRRAERQPRELPNAGSVFRNPPGDFAARLLERCGLKGRRVGGAAFSEQHANFIVNLGGARAEDVCALIKAASAEVLNRTGVRLETEVRLVGEW